MTEHGKIFIYIYAFPLIIYGIYISIYNNLKFI